MTRWPKPEPQSALVVLVPEAEALVARFRAVYDPAAAAGVPAHITILFPFESPAQTDGATIDRLKACFRACTPFDYTLARIERFPDVIYLVPEPEDPLRALTLAVWAAFPKHPPYEGRHPDIIPHLTVAAELGDATLERVAKELGVAAQPFLPLPARAREITLMDNRSGLWTVGMTFPLGRS